MKKRVLSLFMALVLCLTLLPAPALAVTDTADAQDTGTEDMAPQSADVAVNSTYVNGKDTAVQSGIAVQSTENAAEVTIGNTTTPYPSLPAALSAAANGATVTLLANHTTVENDDTTLAVVTKTLTLDLNGFSVDYLMVGEPTYGEENGDEPVDVTITSGSLTIKDSSTSAVGGVDQIAFMSGTLNIAGAIAGEIDCAAENSGENIISETKYGGKVTISGGAVHGLHVQENVTATVSGGSDHKGSWLCDGGTLTITGGEFSDIYFRNNGGAIAISGGTFGTITNNDASKTIPVLPLLADGYAFYSNDAVQNGTETSLTNVQVQPHTHTLGENASCPCGAALVASLMAQDDNMARGYYTSIDEAFAAAQANDTVMLLADITNRGGDDIFVSGGPYTLNLNGRRIDAGINLMVGDMNNSGVLLSGDLTVTDDSADNAGYVRTLMLWSGKLTVEGGNFNWILESNSDSAGTITIKGGTANEVTHCSTYARFKISGGTFNFVENKTVGGKAGDLLVGGFAYANKNTNEIQNGYEASYSAVSNVTVVEHKTHEYGTDGACACGLSCDHSSGMDDKGNCAECGTLLAVASLTTIDGTVYYTDIHAAFDAAKVSDGGTLTLLQDVTLDENDNIYIAPGNFAETYTFTIDWNGYILSGNTGVNLLTFSGRTNVTLKDNDSNAGGVRNEYTVSNYFGDHIGGIAICVSVQGGYCVAIEGGTYSAQVLKYDCSGDLKIKGGVFVNPAAPPVRYAIFSSDRNKNDKGALADLLAEGVTFAYKDENNKETLVDVYSTAHTEEGKTVYVVSHNHGGFDENNKCECGYVCEHAVVNEDGMCTVCGKEMAAMVTKGDESHAYATLADALAKAAEKSGSTLKLLTDAESIDVSNSKNIFYLDLNGKTINTLTVSGSDTPKLMDNAEKKGSIGTISYSGGILASLLRSGWGFKSGDAWLGADALFGASAKDVSVAKASITGVGAGGGTVSYGETATVTAEVRPENLTGLNYQWYKLNGSRWEEVAYATESSYSSSDLSCGNHYFTCAVTDSSGAVVLSGVAAVQVDQASLADAVIMLDQSAFTYQPIGNNEGFSPSIASVTLYNGSHEVPAGAYTIDASSDIKGENVGTYTLRITAKDDSSYTGSASVTWSILPCVLTGIELPSPIKVYDGRAITEGNAFDAPAQTFFYGDGNTKYFALGKDSYTITLDSHTFTSADAGSGKVTFTVTLKEGNYTFKDEEGNNTTAKTFTKPVTIGQAELPKEYWPTATLNVVNGVQQKTYLLDVSRLLKQLPEGCEYGDVIYDADSCNLTGDYENSIATVTNENKLQLNVPQVDSTKEGPVGTVSVKVSTKNYQDFYIVISVNAVNQITPQADGAVSASTIDYGQPLSASTLTGTMKADGETVDGTFTWVDGSTKLDAGKHEAEWRFSPSDDIYAETTGMTTITVNKADLANAKAWITPSDGVDSKVEITYVPGDFGVKVTVKTFEVNGITLANEGKELDENLFAIAENTGKEVGTYTLTITPTESNTNFTGTFTKEWKIVPHEVDWSGYGISDKPYDGTNSLTVSDFSFKSLAGSLYDSLLNEELAKDGYELVNAHYDSASVGDAKTIYFTVKLRNSNYTFAGGSDTKSFEGNKAVNGTNYRIIKATMESDAMTADKAFEIPNKLGKTYEIDLSQYLPTLSDGCEYGDVTYSDLSVDLRSQYYSGGAPGAPVAEIKDGKVILPILKNGETTTGKVGTVQVMVISANYEDFLLYINVNAINKIEPIGQPTLSKDTLIYGEKLGSITLSGALKDPDNGAEVAGTFEWLNPEEIPAVSDDYWADWKFIPDDAETYLEIDDSVKITLEKATPTGKPQYTTITSSGKTLADAGLTGTFSVAGTVQWVDKDGNALPDDTVVEANATYKWKFTPADTNNYNTLEGSITLYSVSTGGGGGSGTVTPPTTTETETTTDPDGTTTKTETKSDGSTVETVTKPDGSTTTTETKTETKPDGSTTTTETKSETNADGSKTETKSETTTAADGSKTETKSETKVEADGTKSETKAETKTDANGVTSGTETTQTTTPDGSTGTTTTTTENGNTKTEAEAKISEKAVEDAKQSGEAVKVPTEVKAGEDSNSAPTVKVELPKDAGETKIEIPVSDVNSGTVAVIVREDGTEEIVKSSTTTENGLQLKVEGSATIKVIDNSKTFDDTQKHWSRDEVNFVASRELFNGVGNKLFGVNESMTRGMVNTVLARLAGIDTTPKNGQKWYEVGTEWARANGITDGTNPEASVTREQLAAMLYRYAGSPAVNGELGFADAEHVSGYAENALLWAVQNGILNGMGDNRVAPKNNAERAQVAAMMARYLKNVG